MNKQLLAILVCPLCKGKLIYEKSEQVLVCKFDKLAYPIEDDIPVMLADKARALSDDECERYG